MGHPDISKMVLKGGATKADQAYIARRCKEDPDVTPEQLTLETRVPPEVVARFMPGAAETSAEGDATNSSTDDAAPGSNDTPDPDGSEGADDDDGNEVPAGGDGEGSAPAASESASDTASPAPSRRRRAGTRSKKD